MAAGVQQHEVTPRQSGQRLEHRVDAQGMRCRIVVRVRFELETGAAEQRNVIAPCRVGHPDRGIRSRAQDQARRHSQTAGTARRLDCRYPIGIDAVTKSQRLHRGVELRIASRTDVGLAVLGIDDSLFRLLDDIQYGRLAFSGAKNPDTEVDFLRAGIVLVLGDEPKDGIRRRSLQ